MSDDHAVRIEASELGRRILKQFKADLGSVWTERLTRSERELAESVSRDAAVVLLLGLAGSAAEAAREKAHVDAQLLNLTSVEAARVARDFWAAAEAVVKGALRFALCFA